MKIEVEVEVLKKALGALWAYKPCIIKRAGLTYNLGQQAIDALEAALKENKVTGE